MNQYIKTKNKNNHQKQNITNNKANTKNKTVVYNFTEKKKKKGLWLYQDKINMTIWTQSDLFPYEISHIAHAIFENV